MSFAEKSQSASEAMELLNASVPPTPPGASGDAAGFVDDDPMCMHNVTPVSLHASKTGSHDPLWIVGSFRWWGSSLKQNARTPRAALRRISAAARCTSQSGMMQRGMFIPFDGPHHSSTIQSLYAFTHASPRSWSSASRKVCPQKRGNVGKGREPSTQFRSKSLI